MFVFYPCRSTQKRNFLAFVRVYSHMAQRSICILVVDDFEPWRRSVCSMLGARPELQVVGEAADGLEAVKKAQTLKPDLVVLDIGLPNLHGIEAANRIRQVVPSTTILFLTAMKDEDVVKAALCIGQGCVLKSDAVTELLPAVAAVLGGNEFVSSGLSLGNGSRTGIAPVK
jgi:DNA-binding NarL/FixJ family response regulator